MPELGWLGSVALSIIHIHSKVRRGKESKWNHMGRFLGANLEEAYITPTYNPLAVALSRGPS